MMRLSARARRISMAELDEVKGSLRRVWTQVQVVDLDELVAAAAGDAAETFGLRGYDAVHLATALALQDESLLMATWDSDLRAVALKVGLMIAPAEQRLSEP